MTKRVFKDTLDFGLVELVKRSVVKNGTEYIVYINRPVSAIERAEVTAFLNGKLERPDWIDDTRIGVPNISDIPMVVVDAKFRNTGLLDAWGRAKEPEPSLRTAWPLIPSPVYFEQKLFNGDAYKLDDFMQYGRKE